jgi:acyl-CoA thioesterase FadM
MGRIKIEMPENFAFTTTLPVRIQDINYGGHLGNDSLLSLLHEVRIQYLQQMGCNELDACGTGLIMADVAIVYKGEGFHGDVLRIQVAAGELSSRGFVLFYNVTCSREEREFPIADARTGMLCFNYETRKVTSLPKALKEKLNS